MGLKRIPKEHRDRIMLLDAAADAYGSAKIANSFRISLNTGQVTYLFQSVNYVHMLDSDKWFSNYSEELRFT